MAASPSCSSCLFLLILFHLTAAAAAGPSVLAYPALHEQDVHALKKIADRLGMSGWNFPVGQPCGDGTIIGCDCSFANGSICHVTSINLKYGNLSGQLPPEFADLSYLQKLDLSKNVLRGSVPTQWAQMQLQYLSLMGNWLSGPFPAALLNITSLAKLSLEGNDFSGPIPVQIGNLVNLEELTLSANEFSGELPTSLAKLTKLTDLQICSNKFTGTIPDFLGKLTNLTKLHIQGSSLEGPIPEGISQLTALIDLRISDLRGRGSSFTVLSGMTKLKKLILRNCSIFGSIPSYVGTFEYLRYIDLSFNKLSGVIPASFTGLEKADFIYLTENMLNGSIPEWILQRNKNVDISYNNFTLGSIGPTQCLQGSINTVESYSSDVEDQNVQPCLKRNFPCSASNGQYRYNLHINCGGNETVINGTKYEADTEQRGASMLYLGPNWAFSSTGSFMDNNKSADNYIATNASELTMNDYELYMQARLSPLSLTYYGLCLHNGEYTVKLHFAEIMFTDDNTFASLGERLFNVFIQDKMVIEDFNIKTAAGGTAKALVKTFTAYVTDHTLKIRFYWAGKGTTGIPERGVYGPLVSAISVTSNFEPPLAVNPSISSRSGSMKIVLGVGIPILASIFILLLVGIMCYRRRRTILSYQHLKASDLQNGNFSLRQIKAATNNFHANNKIGEGGFGSVYKGVLSDGTIFAVKQLSSRSKQGTREFVNEIGIISALKHPNLVKLHGCCTESNQLLLIYEYMENNSLARALFDVQFKLKLDWPTRYKICVDVARALAYLHEDSALKIVHRDIKGSNILLDKDLNAKISDFGIAKLNEDQTHISTRIAGTIGYMAPEYAMGGYLTDKADVYSFGVVTLEIVSGKSNANYRPKEEFVNLLDWACVLQERGNILELIDPELGQEFSKDEAILVLNVALLCTNSSPTLRPKMSKVVSLLDGQAPLQPLLSDLSLSTKSPSSSRMSRNFWQQSSDSQIIAVHSTESSKIVLSSGS